MRQRAPTFPERTEARRTLIAMAEQGHLGRRTAFSQFVHKNRHYDTGLKRVVQLMAEETGPRAHVRQQKAILSRRDWRASLAQIRCPTVVIVGDSDEMTPPKLAEEIASGISGARLVLVPDCGHLTTLERPAEVNAALAAWMADKA